MRASERLQLQILIVEQILAMHGLDLYEIQDEHRRMQRELEEVQDLEEQDDRDAVIDGMNT